MVLYVHVYLENSNEAIGEICVGDHAMSKVRSWREFLILKKTQSVCGLVIIFDLNAALPKTAIFGLP